MFDSIIGLVLLIILIGLMIFCVLLGHRADKRKGNEKQLTIAEGAIFTLMALLVSFTFSNASQRFDQRRVMIIDEANAIDTAYIRLDMLEPEAREILRKDFVAYISSRLTIYQYFQDKKMVSDELKHYDQVKAQLWQNAINACKQDASQKIPLLILPAINTMFDIASTRIAYTSLHPPKMIFLLLILVAFLSAFFTGYNASKQNSWISIHVLAYAIIISLTIYTIFDIELARYGMIKLSDFDGLLIDIKNKMLPLGV